MSSNDIPLALLGFGTTTEAWIRLVGVLPIGLGYYHVRAGLEGLDTWDQSV